MKKIIAFFLNFFLNFFKEVEKKQKIDLMTELLLKEVSTKDAIELYRELTDNFRNEMEKRKNQNFEDWNRINNFNKKNEDIEVIYELIKTK